MEDFGGFVASTFCHQLAKAVPANAKAQVAGTPSGNICAIMPRRPCHIRYSNGLRDRILFLKRSQIECSKSVTDRILFDIGRKALQIEYYLTQVFLSFVT